MLGHAANRREGKVKVAHNRHAGHRAALKAIAHRASRRRGKAQMRGRVQDAARAVGL